MSKSDGGPAFPCGLIASCEECKAEMHVVQPHGGMTLRDYFAAKAMQALVDEGMHKRWELEVVTSEAYKIADAMLEEREK